MSNDRYAGQDCDSCGIDKPVKTSHSESPPAPGLDCHLCAKMEPEEVYKRWGFDYEAIYKDTCKAHRPLMLERMENGLTKLKELLAD